MQLDILTMATSDYLPVADRLRTSAERFGYTVHVRNVDHVHRSISPKGEPGSMNYKARLILDFLETENRPVIWMDCDVTVVEEIALWGSFRSEGFDFGIYNWLADADNAAYMPVSVRQGGGKVARSNRFFRFSHEIAYTSRTQLICSGAVQFWANTPASVALLQSWGDLALRFPRCQDDQLLDCAHNAQGGGIKLMSLPKSYLRIGFWPMERPVIDHPQLPTGGGDWDDLAKLMQKPRFDSKELVPRPTSRKIVDGEVFDIVDGDIKRFGIDSIERIAAPYTFHIRPEQL